MRNAVFVAPFLLPATVRFIAAAASLGEVRLGLISQDPEDRLGDDLRAALAGHYRVKDGTDPQQIADATRVLSHHLGGVDRIIGMLEQLQVPLGELQRLGIAGMGTRGHTNLRGTRSMRRRYSKRRAYVRRVTASRATPPRREPLQPSSAIPLSRNHLPAPGHARRFASMVSRT